MIKRNSFKHLGLGACSLLAVSAVACSSSEPVAGGKIKVTASGEGLGAEGFSFPPTPTQEAYFIDGWEVRFEHFYVSLSDITISADPDRDPNDRSVTGEVVAEAKGPFLVDLHQTGPLPGKGEDDTSFLLTTLENQNKKGLPFDSAAKYAFGYSSTPARASATRVGLAGGDEPNVLEMESKGYNVLYVGKATYRGTTCSPTDRDLPTEVSFRFGFKTPARYINCLNPDLGQSGGEPPPGLALKGNEETIAQITFHADHPFWNALEEDAPLRFDQLAFVAKMKNKGTANAPLTLEDLEGVAFAPLKVGTTTLPARTCTPAEAPPAGTTLSLDPNGESVTDLADFVRKLQVTQGHLNADGLCIARPL
ncbi:MAG: hypothetical protein U0174_06290 [Polyangiaceae bacterium]